MAKSAGPASARKARELVIVKGLRNGLVFVLAENAPFVEVLSELGEKLQGALHDFLSGPPMNVYVDRGTRELTDEDERAIRKLFATHGNLIIGGFDGPPSVGLGPKDPYVYKGTLRSGRVIEHDGDVVLIGDVNAGAQIVATGDVYVMGHLRGSAHAGAGGNRSAVVAAAYFEPLQVRIAGVVRRSPDGRPAAAEMEFAYLDGDQMAVEKMSFLALHRASMRGNKDGGSDCGDVREGRSRQDDVIS